MQRVASCVVVVLALLFAGSAWARSQHAAPTVKKCGNACKVTLPIINNDGHDTVHAWAVPASARGQVSRANILQPPSGIPGAKYLGVVKMQTTRGSTYVLEGQIDYTGGDFSQGQPMHIYTGFTVNNGPSAHIWGVSDGPAFNLP